MWLKRCALPSLTKDAIAKDMVYPAVLLTYGLLPAVVCRLPNGLHELTIEFCQVKKIIDEQREEEIKTPNPRVEMPYTYLIAWLVIHCPKLMTTPFYGTKQLPFC